MSKIPVGETISRAYNFTFSSLPSIVGVMWFPWLLTAAIFVGLVMLWAPDVFAALAAGKADWTTLYEAHRATRLVWLVGIVVSAMVTVGVQEKALSLRQRPVFFYFSLGAPVWRMVGAFFLAGVIVALMTILLVIADVAIWFAAGSYLAGFAGLVRTVAIAASVLWLIYMCVRLTFFLPAVVVAERRIGLDRAWQLGGGNFWRIVGVWIVVLVPVSIAFSLVWNAVVGMPFPFPGTERPASFSEFFSHLAEHAQEFEQAYIRALVRFAPFVAIYIIVKQVVMTGLTNGAAASAYRAVVPKQAEPASQAGAGS